MNRSHLHRLPALALLIAATLAAPHFTAQAQGGGPRVTRAAPPKKANEPLPRKGRESQVIDGMWRFQTDPENRGEQENWTRAAPAETKETAIPALWTTQAAPSYSGTAWYWREFEVKPTWKTQTVRLRFEAVAEKASVWLNGEKLGDHSGGATPFEFNVTKLLHVGDKNLLTVRVEGEAKRGAGIWQGVMLLAHDEAYLAETSLTAGGLGQLASSIVLENTSDNSGGATLDGRVIEITKPDKDVHRSTQNLSVTPGRNVTTLLTSVRGKNLHRWSLETPTLYALQLAFRQNADVLDTQQTTFGFREFGWKDNAITLNGLPFPLKSLAPVFPLPVVVASTEDVDRARTSFQRLKDAGVTVLYLDAPHPDFLDIADQIGLLIVESPRRGLDPQTASEELQALMLRDRSHPCVLGWNLRDGDEAAATKLRSADPSRFFLAGSGATAKLYPPAAVGNAPVTLPAGFLPAL